MSVYRLSLLEFPIREGKVNKKMFQTTEIEQCFSETIDIDANGWGRRQAKPLPLTGFVRTDCHYEETGYKSYLENSSVKRVPEGQTGYDLQQWLSVLSTELELESSPSALQQLPSEQLGPLLRQLLPTLLLQPSGHQVGVVK